MTQVIEHNLAAYLMYMKRKRGYTVIALEQTSNSVMLPQFDFPERVIILLGRCLLFVFRHVFIYVYYNCVHIFSCL